jgi:hypothetical protein
VELFDLVEIGSMEILILEEVLSVIADAYIVAKLPKISLYFFLANFSLNYYRVLILEIKVRLSFRLPISEIAFIMF